MELSEHRLSLPLVRNRKKRRSRFKGPLRVVRLCLLCIALPGLLVAGPLYLRYRVYSEQVYPVGVSDMRLVDSRISTTWCQSQLVTSNTTFNAYLVPEDPEMTPDPVHVSSVRYLELDDDMKEYWGFYLLKGSSVTISTCSRWPGASLVVIRGHNHLRECAYIGDDSSEEEDEIEEKKEEEERKNKTESTEPHKMTRARPGVQFHGHQVDLEEKFKLSHESEGKENDHFVPFRNFLKKNPTNGEFSHEAYLKGEKKKSEEVYEEMLKKLMMMGKTGQNVLDKLNLELKGVNLTEVEERVRREVIVSSLHGDLNEEGNAAEEEDVPLEDEIRGTINGTTLNDMSNSEFWSSFSSSEERLLSCAGLILNLPLTPQIGCSPDKPDHVQAHACSVNKLTYKVPRNGYYFFVFGSENEIQPNYIRVHFQLDKVVYNVSNSVAACTNSSQACSLPLNFFSREKVVLEMPLNSNDSLWNREFTVVSTCEPRTIIYAACVIAVPVLIILFAF